MKYWIWNKKRSFSLPSVPLEFIFRTIFIRTPNSREAQIFIYLAQSVGLLNASKFLNALQATLQFPLYARFLYRKQNCPHNYSSRKAKKRRRGKKNKLPCLLNDIPQDQSSYRIEDSRSIEKDRGSKSCRCPRDKVRTTASPLTIILS